MDPPELNHIFAELMPPGTAPPAGKDAMVQLLARQLSNEGITSLGEYEGARRPLSGPLASPRGEGRREGGEPRAGTRARRLLRARRAPPPSRCGRASQARSPPPRAPRRASGLFEGCAAEEGEEDEEGDPPPGPPRLDRSASLRRCEEPLVRAAPRAAPLLGPSPPLHTPAHNPHRPPPNTSPAPPLPPPACAPARATPPPRARQDPSRLRLEATVSCHGHDDGDAVLIKGRKTEVHVLATSESDELAVAQALQLDIGTRTAPHSAALRRAPGCATPRHSPRALRCCAPSRFG